MFIIYNEQAKSMIEYRLGKIGRSPASANRTSSQMDILEKTLESLRYYLTGFHVTSQTNVPTAPIKCGSTTYMVPTVLFTKLLEISVNNAISICDIIAALNNLYFKLGMSGFKVSF